MGPLQQTTRGKMMFDTVANHPAPAFSYRAGDSWRYTGPERRTPLRPLEALLVNMLDETDHGMLLIGAQDELRHSNHAARVELHNGHPLMLKGQELSARQASDEATLQQALMAARRGRRRMLSLGSADRQVSISVVPLSADAACGADEVHEFVLVVLGKRRVCAPLTLEAYARSIKLTAAETQVLELLCAGVTPNQTALQQGVAVCTVRTQIGSIRGKAGAASISELVRRLAVLPPLVTSLRGNVGLGAR